MPPLRDVEVHVFFGGVVRRRWPVHGPAFRHELRADVDCVRKFAAVTFARVIDEWLAPALGLRPDDVTATGSNSSSSTTRRSACAGYRRIALEISCFIRRIPLFEAGALTVREIAWSATSIDLGGAATSKTKSRSTTSASPPAILRCHLRLTALDDDTWGCSFRREILANVLWSRSRIGRAADAVSREALVAWVTNLRRGNDADEYAMAIALVEDVREFLLAWPRACSKDELRPWKRFVTEVVGRDVDVLLAFCPRHVTIRGRRVSSTCLDPLGPTPDDVVARITAEVDAALKALRRPRFSPRLIEKVVDTSRFACSPETVLRLRGGKDTMPTHFYVDDAAKSDIRTFVEKNDYALIELGARERAAIMGVATRVERWEIDHRVIVEFVSREVLDRFDHTISVGGRSYGCQKFGFVAIHAIARLIKAVQEGRERDAADLGETIERFHANTHLGFPVIDGRKKKVIHFSDYMSEFEYRADKTVGVPDHAVPLSYTEHMSRRLRLYPTRDDLEGLRPLRPLRGAPSPQTSGHFRIHGGFEGAEPPSSLVFFMMISSSRARSLYVPIASYAFRGVVKILCGRAVERHDDDRLEHAHERATERTRVPLFPHASRLDRYSLHGLLADEIEDRRHDVHLLLLESLRPQPRRGRRRGPRHDRDAMRSRHAFLFTTRRARKIDRSVITVGETVSTRRVLRRDFSMKACRSFGDIAHALRGRTASTLAFCIAHTTSSVQNHLFFPLVFASLT